MSRLSTAPALTTKAITALKFDGKPRRVFDGQTPGLYIDVRERSKVFRYRYSLNGDQTFTIGPFGDAADQFTLARARAIRAGAAAMVAQGIHPAAAQRDLVRQNVAIAANTFEAHARAWLAAQASEEANLSAHYVMQLGRALDIDVLPHIGNLPMEKITTADCLAILQRVSQTPAWALTVRRVMAFTFKRACKYHGLKYDPVYPLLDKDTIGEKGEIKKAPRKSNPWLFMAEIPAFLAAVAARPDSEAVEKIGIRLLLLTMVRPNELAQATWAEVDFDAGMWTIPEARMKAGRGHVVPLSRQAVALLRELQAITGDTPFLFPERAARKRTGMVSKMPNMFARYLRRRLGYGSRLTAHGLRATASTALHEVTAADGRARFDHEWIETQLAHARAGVAGFYNHARYLPQRAEMLQWWADATMPDRGNVVPLRKAA